MLKLTLLILVFAVISRDILNCQDTEYGPGFQTMIMNNPAYTGSSPDGRLRMAYMNFFPGRSLDLHSFFVSYDSYFEDLHGGAGVYAANDYLGGIINDLRGGVSYSYFLQAGREFFVNAGLSGSFFHRGFNFNNAVFPDQIDQMGGITLPTSELQGNENKTVLDIGTGFTFYYRRLTGGFAITHLSQPGLDNSGSPESRLMRKYTLHFASEMDLSRELELTIMPVVWAEYQDKYFHAGAGAVLQNSFLSVSTIVLASGNRNLDVQAGFSFRREKLSIFYNYRFNAGSDNGMMPFSLLHQTGFSFSMHNVKKRIKERTINLPDM